MKRSTVFLVGCLLLSPRLSAEDGHTVTNERENYKVSFPKTWTVWSVESMGVLSATTYPKNRAAEGGLVPPGEAAIHIFAHRDETKTIDAWIEESLRHAEEVRRNKIVVQAGRRGDVDSYVEVESRDDVAPGVYHRIVTNYFALKGRLLAAQLEFKEGDPRESTYRSTLDQVVRSLTAVRPSHKK